MGIEGTLSVIDDMQVGASTEKLFFDNEPKVTVFITPFAHCQCAYSGHP